MSAFVKNGELLLKPPIYVDHYRINCISYDINQSDEDITILDIIKKTYELLYPYQQHYNNTIENYIKTVYGCLYLYGLPNELIGLILDYVPAKCVIDIVPCTLKLNLISRDPRFRDIREFNKISTNTYIQELINNVNLKKSPVTREFTYTELFGDKLYDDDLNITFELFFNCRLIFSIIVKNI